MSRYKHLDKYLEKKGKTPKAKAKAKAKKDKKIKDMSQKGKDDLLELIAKDLGYIEWEN